MINYNEGNFPDKITEWEDFADEELGIRIDDEEVWEVAREYDKIPCFENIYMDLLLNSIINELQSDDEYLDDFNYEIFLNARDSHFSINNIYIHDRQDFEKALASIKKENDDEVE